MTTDWDGRLALKASALEAAGRGWRVFPLRPGSLTPAVREWQARATTDPARIERAWSAGPYNVGLVPCSSGLLVLDLVAALPGEQPPARFRLPGVVDGADVLAVLSEDAGERFPTETYTVVGPDGGLQLYFAHPERPCPPTSSGADSRLGWHVAVRSSGSYVPAAGSATSRGRYTCSHDTQPAPWPDWLARLAAEDSSQPSSRGCSETTPDV
ncbi:bifunctional DNA primase/polymerase [Streptomyces sp. NPDC001668]|uniref:bifunctional DNA primase/polymerase n=1 Tax=Streptomyces sp. NPDC001668 TaxID=3364598 RepID=UPI00367A224C